MQNGFLHKSGLIICWYIDPSTSQLIVIEDEMSKKRISGIIKRIEMKNMDKSGKNPRFSIQFFIQYDGITPSPEHPFSAYIVDVQTGEIDRWMQGWIQLSFQTKVSLAQLPPEAKEAYHKRTSFIVSLEQYGAYRVEDYLVLDVVRDIVIDDVVQHQPRGN